MIKNKKNWLTLVLMISSIVLLIGLQVVWLQSLYKDVKRDLRREASFLFSSTIIALQDSIVEKNIKPLPGDTVDSFKGFALRDTFPRQRRHIEIRRRPDHNEVIFFNTHSDSIKKIIRPLMMKVRKQKRYGGYVLQFNLDSIKPETIEKKYKHELIKSGLPSSALVKRSGEHDSRKERLGGFSTEPFPFFQHDTFYVAQFSNVAFFVWEKILPQFLFSIFLTSLTFAAFYLMYRNILSSQRLLEMKNDFIGNVTHELKTPIATMSVALESLKNFNALDNPQRTKEYLEMAQHELNRLSILTDKVLKTAVFESNGLSFATEKVNLEKIAGHVIDSMKLIFDKNQVQLNFLREGNSFFVNGNEDHLTNVLYNLLDNALKYCSSSPVMEVSLKSSGEKIILSVRDNGIGIAPEHQKRIFEKFFRVPTGNVMNTKGYGLGLSYVYNVIKLHRGEIKVESELGGGASFIITLPKLA